MIRGKILVLYLSVNQKAVFVVQLGMFLRFQALGPHQVDDLFLVLVEDFVQNDRLEECF